MKKKSVAVADQCGKRDFLCRYYRPSSGRAFRNYCRLLWRDGMKRFIEVIFEIKIKGERRHDCNCGCGLGGPRGILYTLDRFKSRSHPPTSPQPTTHLLSTTLPLPYNQRHNRARTSVSHHILLLLLPQPSPPVYSL